MASRLVGYSAESQEEKDQKFKDSLENLQARYKILVEADPGLALTDAALRRYLRAFLTTGALWFFHYLLVEEQHPANKQRVYNIGFRLCGQQVVITILSKYKYNISR